MIVTLLDGNGAPRIVSWQSVGTAADASGAIAANLPAGGPFTYQQLLPAIAAGFPYRGGWYIRNLGTHNMYLTEDGTDPSSSVTAVTIKAGEFYPPALGMPYPVTQGAINIAGTAGDSFTCKVW